MVINVHLDINGHVFEFGWISMISSLGMQTPADFGQNKKVVENSTTFSVALKHLARRCKLMLDKQGIIRLCWWQFE